MLKVMHGTKDAEIEPHVSNPIDFHYMDNKNLKHSKKYLFT